MKHVGPAALERLAGLISRLETVGRLKPRSRGVFYAGARACLHFHEDPSGLYADFRPPDASEFERVRVDTLAEQTLLLRRVEAAFGADRRGGRGE